MLLILYKVFIENTYKINIIFSKAKPSLNSSECF